MTVINPGSLGTLGIFVSAEITADGTAQETAHSLGRVPSVVIVSIVDITDGDKVTEGSHDATNCITTVTTGAKYKIIAM